MSTAWAEPRRSASPTATEAVGAELARALKAGDVVLLSGPLGAGKTCFTKGLAQGLGADPELVLSPTFSLVRELTGGRLALHHVDLYRLQGPQEMEALGLDELFDGDGVSVVEWPERLGPLAPAGAWRVALSVAADGSREILCQAP
jgi:tRNA threonylcarbamoyladenosine biosynthesis protein TsaE